MKQNMKNSLTLTRVATITGLTLGAFALSALAGTWTAPGTGQPAGTICTPPKCNVDAPINVGDTSQTKTGPLIVNLSGVESIGLKVLGSMQIVDGNQGAGKVLVSDALGVASWSTTPVLGGVGCPSGQAIQSFNSDGSVNCIDVGGGNTTINNYTHSYLLTGATWRPPSGGCHLGDAPSQCLYSYTNTPIVVTIGTASTFLGGQTIPAGTIKVVAWGGGGGGGGGAGGAGGSASSPNQTIVNVVNGQQMTISIGHAGLDGNIFLYNTSGQAISCSSAINQGYYNNGVSGISSQVSMSGVGGGQVTGPGGAGGQSACSGTGVAAGNARVVDGNSGGGGGMPGAVLLEW